jgi:hypothetical protein
MRNPANRVAFVASLSTALLMSVASASAVAQTNAPPSTPPPTLADAQRLFYSGAYEASAALALHLRTEQPEDLAASELRTSALHFQIKRAIGDAKDKKKAFVACATCPQLFSEFMSELRHGQAIARARLKVNPEDDSATFFLGKLDLNYVWLQSGTLGRKTGWDEYWEARRSLDAVLERNPAHVRAQVARAWIDYIVDTNMPFGTGWLLGGGNKKRGLRVAKEAAGAAAEPFVSAEAGFALWDMLVRERRFAEAVPVAQRLARDFPENQELVKFLARHAPGARP